MEKTKFGVTVGLYAMVLCFSAIFGEALVTLVLGGYALIFERSLWLKKTVVKVALLWVSFMALSFFVGVIPDVLGIVDDVYNIFDDEFTFELISNIVKLLDNILYLARKTIFVIMGILSLNGVGFYMPFVDDTVEKHVTKCSYDED